MTEFQRLFCVCLCLTGITGCGAQTYEQRLAETAKYYEYRERVDQALDLRPWQNQGIELRLPKGFVEVPAPGEGEADQRQPPFFRKPLPGLLSAWNSEVKVDIPNTEVTSKPAWILVCSNHQMWLDRETNVNITPSAFHSDLSDALADNLNFKRSSAVDPWKFVEERVPRGIAYVPFKSFDYITLDEDVDGMAYDVIFYRYSVKDIQLAVIVVAPQAVDRRERLYDKMLLAMEQLSMSGDIPRSSQQKQSASGAGI